MQTASTDNLPRRLLNLDRLDGYMAFAVLVLGAMLGVVLLRGDQIGLSVQSFGPREKGAASLSTIEIGFDEPVDPKVNPAVLAINPAVTGKFNVVNQKIVFQPDKPWERDKTYTVTLKAGIAASSGRQLKRDVQWQFSVRAPRIAYLGPVESIVQNLYLVDPADPSNVQQLTDDKQDSKNGVLGFDVSPDGSKIIYARLLENGTSSLYEWDAATGTSSLLYDCQDASCTNPTYRSDGGAIAFEQTDLNTATGMAPGVPRVWVLDLSKNSVSPLFKDTQELGYSPRWSADGSKLAVYNVNAGGIMIHDFKTGKDSIIKTLQGEIGSFSPDGKWMYFPKVVEVDTNQYATHFVLVDISSDMYIQHDLISDSDPANDTDATWLPDSKSLIVARRAAFSRTSAQGTQVLVVDIASGKTTPLVEGTDYTNDKFSISPFGDVVLFERFSITKSGARPEIWTYNLNTKDFKQIVPSGTAPRWMP